MRTQLKSMKLNTTFLPPKDDSLTPKRCNRIMYAVLFSWKKIKVIQENILDIQKVQEKISRTNLFGRKFLVLNFLFFVYWPGAEQSILGEVSRQLNYRGKTEIEIEILSFSLKTFIFLVFLQRVQPYLHRSPIYTSYPQCTQPALSCTIASGNAFTCFYMFFYMVSKIFSEGLLLIISSLIIINESSC